MSSLRWRLMARAQGFDGSPLRYVGYYFIGMFFNLALPTSVGGDVVRVWYLAGHDGAGPASGRRLAALVSVLADRVNGVVVLVAANLRVGRRFVRSLCADGSSGRSWESAARRRCGFGRMQGCDGFLATFPRVGSVTEVVCTFCRFVDGGWSYWRSARRVSSPRPCCRSSCRSATRASATLIGAAARLPGAGCCITV